MGDVPPEKINSTRAGGKSSPLAPMPNVSSTPGTVQPARPVHGQPSSTGYPGPGLYGPSSSLDMGNMAYSLPTLQSQSPYDQQHLVQFPSPAHAQGLVYPVASMGPYPGQNPGGMPYGVRFATPYSPYALPQHSGAGGPVGGHYPPFVTSPSMQTMGPGQAPVYGATYYHAPYTTSYGQGPHPSTGHSRPPGPHSRPASRARAPPKIAVSTQSDTDKQAAEEYDVSKTIVDGSNPMRLGHESTILPQTMSTSSSTPRGPPRKPKQSGHALWVGNLPPGANVLDLKDHFSQDATKDIESVFLISKSNCAFVNYQSATACAAALVRFHDSRFQGVRLVCRLRKGFTAPGFGAGAVTSRSQSRDETVNALDERPAVQEATAGPRDDGSRSLDRYFVVKSLTVDDLELSKQSGIWATQTHNETNLNQAFETTEHVYLIFSANKSGEYFGYARMLSPINDDEELALEMPPRPEPLTGAPDELDVTTTVATSTAPRGRIIDDSARGTIFWEVESSEEDDARSEKSVEEEVEVEAQSFGKPFRIQWLSTERVPFHRTRGLRNPWNANREVKIARDGTEIEPTVGRKLVQLFHLT
ncbi:Nucleotide-binding alpha-beta plait [Penicillium atrosanguineum]|uniref:Nucleotide-binding alpha-beta plait n=1 Tax=Penicillium atrosanguineum TaxID=1132637 RepID=A0A9W9H8F9_9EURO|nr:Nucleotide-binding alpha-beta plait [Penicillium atrosanguineum]KAJ5140559.1 Nucleotide-binding alpha-beta plait [Penicillium atrosanguineum]KAJ5315993.1 Nucleotide-binding alpha-beta plait [Penicillium atrosanguineum]